MDISKVHGCHLLQQMSSQWGPQKLLQGLVPHELIADLSVFDPFLTQWIIAILSKGCKPDSFESQTSLKLSFTIAESNSPDILALCETNLDDSMDSGNFSVRGYLPLIQQDSITHMHWSCRLCERRPSFCTRLISGKLWRFLLMFSIGFTLLSALLLFPLLITFFFFAHDFLLYFI